MKALNGYTITTLFVLLLKRVHFLAIHFVYFERRNTCSESLISPYTHVVTFLGVLLTSVTGAGGGTKRRLGKAGFGGSATGN